MATHARQQYFADESSLSKEKREFSIAEEVQQKIDSIEEGAQVNTIETIKVNGVEVQPDGNKAIDLAVPGVVDSLDSTSSTDALSARQGKVLYDYIQDVSHIGHFLALWNASTGLPVTNPDTSPYVYNTGDFYTISVVAPVGGTNYRPDGTQFVIGQASTTVETENISVNDFYFYDGQVWRHMVNSGTGSIAIDDSLSTTSTNPVTNRRVTQAINSKQDVLTAGVGINIDSNNEISNTQPGPIISATQPSTANEGDQWYDTTNSVLKVYNGTQWNEVGSEGNTKTFYLSNASDLTTAQAAYDWYKAGKNPITIYNDNTYVVEKNENQKLYFRCIRDGNVTQSGYTQSTKYTISLSYNNLGVVTQITPSTTGTNDMKYLRTDINYSTPYTPTYDGSPATKKYVDDNIIQVGTTAPSSPTEGMVWYDTTNDVLKVYDGTNWNVTGKEYTQGNGINIANDTISVDTTVVATQTDLSTKQDTLVSGTSIKTINGVSILGSGNITTPAVVLSLPAVGDDERELYAALYTGRTVTLKSGSSYYQVWKFIDNTSTTGKFTVCASNGNDNVTDDATIGYMITGEISNGITAVTQYSKDYFTALNNGVRVFSYEAPLGTYWNVSSALDWQNQGGQVIFKRNNYLSPDHKDTIYYVSYWDMNNNTIYLLSETGTGLVENVVTYNASGQVTNVTTTSLGLQVSPNSTITGIKYVWYGTESDYANLSQYYTDTPGDTEFHTF